MRAEPGPSRGAGRASSKSSKSANSAGVADPEAATLLLRLLVRYAENVEGKDDLDLQLERQLGGAPDSRNAIRRLTDRYLALPAAERRTLFGEGQSVTADTRVPLQRYRDVVKRVGTPRLGGPRDQERESSQERAKRPSKHFRSESPTQPDEPEDGPPPTKGKRSTKTKRGTKQPPIGSSAWTGHPLVLPASFTTMQEADRYQLIYNGLWAHHETDGDHGTDSDEIYVIFTVVDGAGNVVTTRRPSGTDPPYHWDVDSGEYRPKSRRTSRIWGGAGGRLAQDVVLSVAVFEQDSGDPADIEAAINGVWAAAAAVCTAAGETAPAACGAALVAAVAIDVVVRVLTGGGDDEIETKSIEISADELEEMADRDLTTFREEDLPCHFRFIHNGSGNAAGADYHTYFAVRRVE